MRVPGMTMAGMAVVVEMRMTGMTVVMFMRMGGIPIFYLLDGRRCSPFQCLYAL